MPEPADGLDLEGFLEFDRRSAPIATTPFITLQKKGLMSLNSAAFDALGSAEAVTLLYHPERRIVGLRPAQTDNPRAYPVRRQGARKEGGGNYLIAGTAFTTFHKIPNDVARRYGVKKINDTLTFDLNEDAPVVTGPRTKSMPSEP